MMFDRPAIALNLTTVVFLLCAGPLRAAPPGGRPGPGASWTIFDRASTRDTTTSEETGSFESSSANLRLSVPVYMDEDLRIFSGLRVSHTALLFNSAVFSDVDAWSLALPVSVMKHLSRDWNIFGLLSPSVSTDFDKVSGEDLRGSLLVLANCRCSSTFTLTFGAVYLQSLGSDRFFPALGFDWAPAPAWNLLVSFPRSSLAYQPAERTRISLDIQPAGGRWNVAGALQDSPEHEQYDINLTGFSAGLTARFALHPAVDLACGGGTAWGRSYEVNLDDETVAETDIDSSWFGSVALTFRIPD